MQANGLTFREVLSGPDADAILGRIEEDKLVLAFARWAEAKLRRWVDYRRAALLFTTVPGDPCSGAFHIYDRAAGSFWLVEIANDGRFGGYREDEFNQLAETFGLKELARNPRERRAVA
jgi:hypothetical protein